MLRNLFSFLKENNIIAINSAETVRGPLKEKLMNQSNSITLVFCIFLSTFLSFFLLGNKMFSQDELASVSITHNWTYMLHTIKFLEGNMWLYYFLLHFWLLFGKNEFWVRSLSAIFAIATVPVVFFIGKAIFNEKVASIATFLIAINIYFIAYAQIARSYSLELFLTSLSSFFFIKYIQERSRRFLFAFAFIDVFSAYTHIYALLLIVVQVLFLALLLRKSVWKDFTIVSIFMFFVLPLFLAPSMHSGQIDWIPKPTIKSLIGTFLVLSGDFIPAAGIYMTVFCIYIFSLYRKTEKIDQLIHNWKFSYILTWLLLPIIISFLFSTFVKPIYTAAYFIICLVPFTLLFAYALKSIEKKWLQYGIIGLLVIFAIIRLYSWYAEDNRLTLVMINYEENWRGASQFLASHVHTNDAIVYFPSNVEGGIHYYTSSEQSFYHVTEINIAPDRFITDKLSVKLDQQLLKTIPHRFSRVWFVLETDGLGKSYIEPIMEIQKTLRNGFHIKQKIEFTHIIVTLYEK